MISECENTTLDINDLVDTDDKGANVKLSLYIYLIPLIGTMIIVMNGAVVIVSGLILKKGQQPRSTYLFLGNVAMSDLVTGIAVLFGQLYPKDNRDHYTCAIQIGLIVSSTIASVYSVGLIAIDRFLYIVHGMKYQKWVYPTRARLLIVFTWILGVCIGFLPLMGWYEDTSNGKFCWFILLAPKPLILLTVHVGILPLVLVLILYSIILYTAIQKIIQHQKIKKGIDTSIPENLPPGGIRMFRGGSQSLPPPAEDHGRGIFTVFKPKSTSSPSDPSKLKAIKIVLFTTGSFVITWVPYFTASIIYALSCNDNKFDEMCKTIRAFIASPLAILGFMNSFLNPIIYAWWHKGFRGYLKRKWNIKTMRRQSKISISDMSNKENSRHTSISEIEVHANIKGSHKTLDEK